MVTGAGGEQGPWCAPLTVQSPVHAQADLSLNNTKNCVCVVALYKWELRLKWLFAWGGTAREQQSQDSVPVCWSQSLSSYPPPWV